MDIRKIGAAVTALVVVVGAYFFGYRNAETEGNLAIEQMRREQAEAVIKAQDQVRVDYEERIQALSAELERVRSDSDKRVRELARFKANSSRNLQTCNHERNRLAEIAVGLEEVADGAISRLESITGK